MRQAVQDLRKRAAELIAATDIDARQRNEFYNQLRQLPNQKQALLAGLGGASATGMVVGGAQLLTPNEAEAILTGRAQADDATAGALLTASALGGVGAAGLTAQAYVQRMNEVAEAAAMRQRHNKRKPQRGRY